MMFRDRSAMTCDDGRFTFLLHHLLTALVLCVHRFLPYVGYVTIAMVHASHLHLGRRVHVLIFMTSPSQNDIPQFRYALFGALGLMALFQSD